MARFQTAWSLPIAVGILLRSIWISLDPHLPFSDEIVYHTIAVDLAAGRGFGLQIYTPGWPMILGMLYTLFGAHVTVGIWFNGLVSVATIVCVGLLTRQMFGRQAAIFSLWLMALMPSNIVLTVVLGIEVWLQFLLVFALWLGLRKPWTWQNAVALACVAVLTTLVRPFWILLPLLLWISARWYGGHAPSYRQLVTTYVAVALLLTPCVVAASIEAGQFVPVASNGGLNLWIGNNPKANGTYFVPPPELLAPQNDAIARKLALDYMLHNPWRTVQLIPAKLYWMFRTEAYDAMLYPIINNPGSALIHIPNFSQYVGWLMRISYFLLSGAALLSIALLLYYHYYSQLAPLVTLFAYNVASYLPFFGFARYRWPLQFVLVIVVAALPLLLRTMQQQRQRAVSQLIETRGS